MPYLKLQSSPFLLELTFSLLSFIIFTALNPHQINYNHLFCLLIFIAYSLLLEV